MSQFQTSDIPIEQPDEDLLGMEAYTSLLASRIMNVETPFTIGVYGEWGSGKTSFVNLIRHSLVEEYESVKFISFSAWPHTTADALWRALVIKIVKDLYDITDIQDQRRISPVEKQKSFLALLSEFMIAKNLTLWSSPPSPPQSGEERSLQEYREFIAALDKTSYGSISKDATQHYQINQEVAMMAIVNAAMDALGTISPLLAALRRFMGFKSEYNLSDFLHKTKNQAMRDRVESVQEFKDIFHKVFKARADKYERIFVFIDDLDRCLPDAALDILEAIKIFFDEIGCVFIIAADENLIGQGLRLRYRNLPSLTESEDIKDYFIQKGREYFEKIIQFGIKVPPRTPEQIRDFITLQFPKWTLTTDILETIIGSNPRRLKQQCRLLSYQYDVGLWQKQTPINGIYKQFLLLEKMVAFYNLYTQDPDSQGAIKKLIKNPNKYYKTMHKLEERFATKSVDAVNCGDFGKNGKILCEVTARSPVLASIFRQWDKAFSDEDPDSRMLEQLEVLIEFIDVVPSLKPTLSIFETKDKAFLRVIESVNETRSILPSEIIRISEEKLQSMANLYPNVAQMLVQQAQSANWTEQMLAIEARFDKEVEGEEKRIELNLTSREISHILTSEITQKMDIGQEVLLEGQGMPSSLRRRLTDVLSMFDVFESDASLRSIFIDERLNIWSISLPEANNMRDRILSTVSFLSDQYNNRGENALVMLIHVLLDQTPPGDARAEELGDLAQELEQVLSLSSDTDLSERDENPKLLQLIFKSPRLSTLVRSEVLGILDNQSEEYDLAHKLLEHRIIAARHVLRLRKFAKLYALDTKWPELGRQLRDDSVILEELEKLALQPRALWNESAVFDELDTSASQSSNSSESLSSAAARLWEKYQSDPVLIEFLNLRPLFANIYPDERLDYFTAFRQIEAILPEETKTEQQRTFQKVSHESHTSRQPRNF